MTHRYFAGTEGILILILSLSMLFSTQTRNLKSTCIAILLMGLVIVQIMLGMLTVTEKLKPVIVLSHLLTGLSILSVLWWVILDLHYRHATRMAETKSPRFTRFIWLALMLVVGQIALGGWVTHYAGSLWIFLIAMDRYYLPCNGAN